MTKEKLCNLKKGDLVEVDDPEDDHVYQVLSTDTRMGRIEMRQISFEFEYDGRYYPFDSFDEAMDEIEDICQEDADVCLDESDIKEELVGEPFWMHYKDVIMHF